MKKVTLFVLVFIIFLLQATLINAANLNQIQQQVLETAQERQSASVASDSGALIKNPQLKTVTDATVLDSPSTREILWQAFDGKIQLWKFKEQLYLSFNFF